MKKNLYIVTLLLCFVCIAVYFAIWHSPESIRLTSREFNNLLSEKREKKDNAKPGYPGEMLQWYYEQRAYPSGKIPAEWRQRALSHITSHNLRLNKNTGSLAWTQLGPRNIGGRIRSIVIDPKNSNVIYIGSVSGGVWKTINAGQSWFPLKDDMENLSISTLVIDPNNNNIVYAGTGEGFFNFDALRGEGIFKSTDAGTTWKRLTSTFNSTFHYVNRLAIDKTTGVLWAATRDGLYGSIDGGETFVSVLTGENTHCTDVKIAYTNPTTIYASFGIYNSFEVYRSIDAGNSFNLAYNSGDARLGRTELAVSTADPRIAYLSSMDLDTYRTGIMRVTGNAGESWHPINIAGGTDTYTSSQAWYNNVLTVDPDDPNTLYAAGLNLYKSSDMGNTWQQMTEWYYQTSYPFVHADHHSIVFDPNNSNVLYTGNDGGIYRSRDKGVTWEALNNDLFITQFYYGAVHPTAETYYGGTQDNGTLKSSGGTEWTQILGGDGGAVEVDFTNPDNIYMEYVRFAFYKTTDAGASFMKMMDGIPSNPDDFWAGTSDRCEFIAPFTMDPNNPNILVGGTFRVYRTTNGAVNWNAISGDLTGDGTGISGAKISALAIAEGNSNVIYAGCTNGALQVTTDYGQTWDLRNDGLPNAYLKRIAIHPDDPATAFVVFSGFIENRKIFMTNDYGQSWKNISGDLPNIPLNCLLLNPANPNNIIVGTDLGVFSTLNGGRTWIQENDGLPNVSVADLDLRRADNKIFAATHGRGMFFSSLNVPSGTADNANGLPATYDISQNYPNPFNPVTTIKYQLPSDQNVRVTVFDLNGKKVKELVNDNKPAGHYETSWNGMNEEGVKAASGIYFYSIQAGSFQKSMKMVLMK